MPPSSAKDAQGCHFYLAERCHFYPVLTVQQIVNTYYVNFYGRWPNECDCVSYILRETGRETLTRGGPENGVGSKERDPTSEW